MRWLTAFLFPALIFLLPTQVLAKSYEIENSKITIDVGSDGSGQVFEEYDFVFDGQFSFVERWIQKSIDCSSCPPYTIQFGSHWSAFADDLESGLGSYKVTQDSEKLKVFTNLPPGVSRFPYKLQYKVVDLVTMHSDVAEIYWNVVGKEWEVAHKNIALRINLPFKYDSSEVDLYVNGVLKDTGYSGGVVNLSGLSTFASSPLVVRLVFPNTGISSPRVGSLTREGIAKEEKSLILPVKLGKDFYLAIALSFIPLLWLLYLYIAWRRVGDDAPAPSVNLANSLHEPPSDLHPALVDALLNPFGVSGPQSFVASIIRLIDMKVIDIATETKDKVFGFGTRKLYRLIASKNYEKVKLDERDTQLVNFLFTVRGVGEISFDEIKTAKKISHSEATQFWDKWKNGATSQLVELGYLEKRGARYKSIVSKIGYIGLVSAIALAQLGIFSITGSGFYLIPFLTLVASLLVTLLVSSFFNKRTEFGNREYAKWLAFKKHLVDYSVTKNHPIDSVVLWGKYLIYGAALGVSLKAISQLPVSFAKNTGGALALARVSSPDGRSLAEVLTSINTLGATGVSRSGGYGGSGRAGGGGGGRAG